MAGYQSANPNHAFGLYGGQQFQPREYQIGDQKFVAHTQQEARNLERQRSDYIKRNDSLNGAPDRPEYATMIDPTTGMIKDQYQIGGYADQVMGDDLGYQKFEQEALRDGPSAYAQLMLEQQGLERQDRIGDINSQYTMASQNAMDQMASQGGLYGGARERMGANSIRDLLSARQGARSDFQKQKLGIHAQDEQNRIGQLQALTGMEQSRNQMQLGAKEFDLRNTMSEVDNKRKDDLGAWTTQMESWAANKSADAQRASAGSCFPAGTLVEMQDKTKKPIEQIDVGDFIFGGEVTKVIKASAKGANWFEYDGTIVTGDHAVMEAERWIRVKDTEMAKPVDQTHDFLYNLSNEAHFMIINDRIFSDYDEVDFAGLSNFESLERKNTKECTKSIS